MFISAVATLLGFWICGISPLHSIPWLPVLIMMLLTAFANSHNDLVDYPIDLINRPKRPLPSGNLTRHTGLWLAWGSFSTALVLSLISSLQHAMFFGLMASCLWLYNTHLKGLPLVGNVCVAILTTSPLLVAAAYTGWKNELWPPMLFAFLLSLAREIIKDIEDIPGDRSLNLHTLPILLGFKFAQKLSFTILVLTLGALALPVLCKTYPWPFLVFCAVLVAPAITLALVNIYRQRWRKAQSMVKLAMLCGILAALAALQF